MRWSMHLIPTDKVSTGNAETMSAMTKLRNLRDSIREGTVTQRNDKTWKATHFRSGAQSLQVNKNRSRCGHVNTVTGKCLLGDPVSDEDSMRAEQLDYFEKVIENSMATSEERVQQLREPGCRATRWMPTATGSTAAVKD